MTGDFGAYSYGYDAIGNMTLNTEAGPGTYDYGTARPQAVKSANGVSYTYDLCGNMTLRGSQKLAYDAQNRLESVTEGGSVIASFGYDSGGQRLWKQTPAGVHVWIGSYFEDRQGEPRFHVLANGKRVCTVEPGTSTTHYTHGDHLGSASILTAADGTETRHWEYSPYGRERYPATPQAFTVSHRFTDQILDEETGLYYYGARYYDPELGRFIQADTMIPDMENPQSLNRYAYVLNNPLKYNDPSGNSQNNTVFTAESPIPVQIHGPINNSPVFQPLPKDFSHLRKAASSTDRRIPELTASDPNNIGPRYTAPKKPNQIQRDMLNGMGGAHLNDSAMGTIMAEQVGWDIGFGMVGGGVSRLGTKLFGSAIAAERGGQLVPMGENLLANGTPRTVAGYNMYGNAGLVGETYNVNVLGLYKTGESQGLRALSSSLINEGRAAGASQISISGNAIINEGFSGMSPAAAQRFGFQLKSVNAETIILKAPIP